MLAFSTLPLHFSLTFTGISACLVGFAMLLGPGIVYGNRPKTKQIKSVV
jgi:hypothetical protein